MIFSAAIAAQDQFEDQRVLVPLATFSELPGAHGSLWSTKLSVINEGISSLTIFGLKDECGFGAFCTPTPLPPGFTVYPEVPPGKGTPGAFLWIRGENPSEVQLQLRVQDVSRQAQTWGTEIPVVWESDVRTGVTNLLDVPSTEEFRQLLRVYDLDPSPEPREVTVRIYGIDDDKARPDPLLTEILLPVTYRGVVQRNFRASEPGYGELDLTGIITVLDYQAVRVEIIPSTSDLRYWAFISVTNNETQHVTTVTP